MYVARPKLRQEHKRFPDSASVQIHSLTFAGHVVRSPRTIPTCSDG